MTWLPDDHAKLHESIVEEQIENFKKEDGLSDRDVIAYIEKYYHGGNFSEGSDFKSELGKVTEGMGLEVFYRGFPVGTRKRMLITNNPGFPDIYRHFMTGEGVLHGKYVSQNGTDMERLAQVCAHHIVTWLHNSTNLRNRFKTLARGLSKHDRDYEDFDLASLSGDDQSVEEYFQIDEANYWKQKAYRKTIESGTIDSEIENSINIGEGFFNDFYYTTAYKFATSKSNSIKENPARKYLYEEIKTVDPDIVYAAGKYPWEWIRDWELIELETKFPEDPPWDTKHPSSGIKNVEQGIFKVDGGPMDYLVALQHPNSMKKFRKDKDGGTIHDTAFVQKLGQIEECMQTD